MATNEDQLTGCVKWFDNGLNYGFITVLSEGEYRNTDVFVHQSNIKTSRDCFRTLYTGECVQFTMASSDNDKHPFHAVNVSGYNGTMLHCENPNYRGRGVNRGGSRGRGGYRGRGGNRGNSNRTDNQQQSENVMNEQSQTTANDNATTVTATSNDTLVQEPVVVKAPSRRGRGKKSQSA
jgi:cold shock CspA family protein